MELNIFDIIKKPVITSKSVDLFKRLGKITFEVSTLANKLTIRQAVEKIWNVKVSDVCIVNNAGKVKIFARKPFKSPDKKKAIVTLKKGYKIDIPGMIETIGAAEHSLAKEVESEGK
jgi:large subunit ribosomal protein L23